MIVWKPTDPSSELQALFKDIQNPRPHDSWISDNAKLFSEAEILVIDSFAQRHVALSPSLTVLVCSTILALKLLWLQYQNYLLRSKLVKSSPLLFVNIGKQLTW